MTEPNPARTGGAARDAAMARYYDLDLRADDPGDLALYAALAARQTGPILELAAGSGRLCAALAAAGHDVTGVDLDNAMLERARAEWASAAHDAGGSLTLIEHDLTTLALDRRFGLVILAFNSLVLLGDRAAQAAALEVMARHLAADGVAVIDVWLPTPDDLLLYDGRLVLDWVRRDDETGELVAKSTSARYESATARASITSFYDAWHEGSPAQRSMRRDEVAFIGATELVALARSSGLQVEALAGDYEMNEFNGNSERIVLVGRLAAD